MKSDFPPTPKFLSAIAAVEGFDFEFVRQFFHQVERKTFCKKLKKYRHRINRRHYFEIRKTGKLLRFK
jgi:hypothetical protein